MTSLFRRILVSYAISAGVWLSIGLLSNLQDHLNNPSKPIDLTTLGAGLLFYICVALLTPPVFYLGKRLPLTGENLTRSVTIYILGAPLFSFLYGVVRWTIAPPWSNELHQFVARSSVQFWPTTYAHFAGLFWIYLEILLTANALVYFERARSAALDRAEVEKALTASELQLLKSQLQPHFLFNTLHGIATLVNDDPPRASEMILQLATLLRATIDHSNSDLVPLRDELKFVSTYLDLEKMRLGSRMVVHWSIDNTIRDAQVPHMLLQPLVENAVVHGIASSRNTGFIEIQARRIDQTLRITVTNSVGQSKKSGSGVGLRNTQARLRHLYGDDAELQFMEKDDERVAIATLSLPLLCVAGNRSEAIQQEA